MKILNNNAVQGALAGVVPLILASIVIDNRAGQIALAAIWAVWAAGAIAAVIVARRNAHAS
ncbi:hypothetical protein [Gordonia alkaliphila]|uniref:Uncharacterized protein n=1 Tax=Gordonia alkaliphila TaxID=1053547 RepID=A0ABP8ZK84_9ACTN